MYSLEALEEYDEQIGSGFSAVSGVIPGANQDQNSAAFGMEEKQIRREIANSVERRRMKNINAGFQALKALLPSHSGEKLSKAAILQCTAEYITYLEHEKTRLLAQNCYFKRLLSRHIGETITADDEVDFSPIPDSIRDLIEIRLELDTVRKQRMALEDKVRKLEKKLQPETKKKIVHQVQLQFQQEVDDNRGRADTIARPLMRETDPLLLPSPSPPHSDEFTYPMIGSTVNSPQVDDYDLMWAPDQPLPEPRMIMASSSRHSIDTIFDAIRHLEGDNVFNDDNEQL